MVDKLIDNIVAEESRVFVSDPDVAAVFVSELEIDGDPMGGDASGSVSLLGAADMECGGAGCDGDWAPPVIVYANGSGTKNASSQVSARPQLL